MSYRNMPARWVMCLLAVAFGFGLATKVQAIEKAEAPPKEMPEELPADPEEPEDLPRDWGWADRGRPREIVRVGGLKLDL